MQRIKIFLSSRSKNKLKLTKEKKTISDLRHALVSSLEKEEFLNESLLDLVIHESQFQSSTTKNAFDNCMEEMRQCHIIVTFYTGEAGWAPSELPNANGICHEEYLLAVNEFSDMHFMMDLRGVVEVKEEKGEAERNSRFQEDVEKDFFHRELIPLTDTFSELVDTIKVQIKGYIFEAIARAFTTQKRMVAAVNTFGSSLDWSKLSYQERTVSMKQELRTAFQDIEPLRNIFQTHLAVPDNISIADARAEIGRPFLKENSLLANSSETWEAGFIHVIAVYGGVTELQAKNLVGFPDIAVLKSSFGLYLWEQNMHIQMFFLKECKNPQMIRTRIQQLNNWLSASKELRNIQTRAESRFRILKAIQKESK